MSHLHHSRKIICISVFLFVLLEDDGYITHRSDADHVNDYLNDQFYSNCSCKRIYFTSNCLCQFHYHYSVVVLILSLSSVFCLQLSQLFFSSVALVAGLFLVWTGGMVFVHSVIGVVVAFSVVVSPNVVNIVVVVLSDSFSCLCA